ncbi:hypothetical protein ACFY8N_20815 [Streptomyces collinus]|uniref:hypothetical protein n=1 Tax=Streptomyces collinus TaxID=42684 RepID=UPI00367B204B
MFVADVAGSQPALELSAVAAVRDPEGPSDVRERPGEEDRGPFLPTGEDAPLLFADGGLEFLLQAADQDDVGAALCNGSREGGADPRARRR